MSAYQRMWYEFDGPVKCELKEDTILRVYGTDFSQAFLRGAHSELELWARPLKTSVVLDLEELDFQLGQDLNTWSSTLTGSHSSFTVGQGAGPLSGSGFSLPPLSRNAFFLPPPSSHTCQCLPLRPLQA